MLKLLLRPLVPRFIAGQTTDEAIKYAKKLRSKKILPLFDVLGEHAQKKAEIVRVMGQYLELLEKMHTQDVKGAIAVKLTALGLDIDPLLCYRATLQVVQRAEDWGMVVWLDMEDSPYTQRTISTYNKLHQQHSNVGICIQADLKRSKKDVLTLLLDAPRIRLVKGVYKESESVAYTSHHAITQNFKELLKLCLQRNAMVAVASHDPELLQYAQHISPNKSNIEFQLLKGVRDDEKKMLVDKGYRVYEYVPFGPNWEKYIWRRIVEHWRSVWWNITAFFEKK